MAGYTPLFGSIVTSSIWNENSETRVVWITMLALADANGKVEGSISGLAPVARVSLESCEKALKKLKQPDKYSRTKEFDGRRIEDAEGGWQILNFIKFREKAKSRAEYYRQWRANRDLPPEQQSEERNKSRIRMMISRAVRNGTLSNPATLFCVICKNQAEMYHHPNGYDNEHELDIVPVCKKCHKQIHLSKTNTKTNTNTNTQTAKQYITLQNSTQPLRKNPKKPCLIEYSGDFLELWKVYPKKTAKGKAFDAWCKIRPDAELLEKMLAAVEQQKQSTQWQEKKGRFIPNPATWLNQERWDDELQRPPEPKRGDPGWLPTEEEAKVMMKEVGL